MKPDSTDMPPPTHGPSTPQWQGLDDYIGSPEFLEAVQNEFPEDAATFTDPVSRRRFIGLMGASVALATGAGCMLRPSPQRKILPYTTQPDEIQPGIPLFFATAAPLSGYGAGVLVRSHEGRPVKVEGNPDHPSSVGGTSVFSQASVLDLYDPDRSQNVTYRGSASTIEEAVSAIRQALYTEIGEPIKTAKLRILTETVTSPSLAHQIGQFLDQFPEAKWVQHDPAVGNTRAGLEVVFGKPVNVMYDFTKADVVLSLDADFLTTGPGAARYSREFADRRKIREHGKSLKEIHEAEHKEEKDKEKKEEKGKEHNGHGHDAHHKEGVLPEALNRLYAVECMPTSTGSVADHRLPLASGKVEAFARALAAELGVAGIAAGGTLSADAQAWIKPLADDLKTEARKGKSIVVAGDHQPPAVHGIVAAINEALGNVGHTVFYIDSVEAHRKDKVIDLKTLTEEMAGRQVDVLLILGVNAAYTAPANVNFAEAVKEVLKLSVHLGTHQDETSVLCQWHINEAHYLETWGDIRGHDGTATIQQPLIAPLYDGVSTIELLAGVMAGRNTDGYGIVRSYWSNTDAVKATFPALEAPATFDLLWEASVRKGVIEGTASKPLTDIKVDSSKLVPAAASTEDGLELNFRADTTIYDGRFANNGWLQELPKPVTKMTWDNAAFMSPTTAKELGLPDAYFRWTGGEHGRAEVPVVELKLGDRTVKAPVWQLPGHADGAVTIHLGYGRTRAGNVNRTPNEPNAAGEPIRGFDAYTLRMSETPWFASGVTVTATGEDYFLACVQGQVRMYQTDLKIYDERKWDRKPVRHGDLDLYNKYPRFAKIPPAATGETGAINENVPAPSGKHDEPAEFEAHDKRLHPLSMYYDNQKFERFSPDLPKEQQRRWAMAVDLNACTGCSACVVACVSENNTPVVGKTEVTRGRAMHWINIDRYYEGPLENPTDTLFQPRMCVQCENAPCEVVCPVGATVHSTDGLNDMAYNRCVGTRYCSNNCPYKVRRFNFLTYSDWDTNSLKLGRNPDVSVRSRGVMEKCTFCVQRIRGAEIVAERELAKGLRPYPEVEEIDDGHGHKVKVIKPGTNLIKDGEIITACQAACPSGAIVFGDLNDQDAAVSHWKHEPRNYGLLAELNTRPRLTHLAIVRNPNPAMPNTPEGA